MGLVVWCRRFQVIDAGPAASPPTVNHQDVPWTGCAPPMPLSLRRKADEIVVQAELVCLSRCRCLSPAHPLTSKISDPSTLYYSSTSRVFVDPKCVNVHYGQGQAAPSFAVDVVSSGKCRFNHLRGRCFGQWEGEQRNWVNGPCRTLSAKIRGEHDGTICSY